jgi:hypothetical protein
MEATVEWHENQYEQRDDGEDPDFWTAARLLRDGIETATVAVKPMVARKAA